MKETVISLKKLLIRSKKYLLLFGISFVLGCVAGVLFTTALSKAAMAESVIKFYFNAFSGGFSPFKFAFSLIIADLCFFALAYICSFIPILSVISFAFVFYRGYVVSAVCVLFVRLFGVGGAFLYVFCVLIHNVLVSAAVSSFCSIMLYVTKNCKKSAGKLRKELAVASILVIVAAVIVEVVILSLLLRPINTTF